MRDQEPEEPTKPALPDATAAGDHATGDRTIPARPPAGAEGRRSEPAAPSRSTAGTAADPLLGQVLGGCRIDALLGRGAMGAVYKARQLRLDREVAVKVIRPELLADPRILQRFQVEARTVGRFQSQHVVMVHDVGAAQDVHFLVMEFVQGSNLREYTRQLPNGRLSLVEALPLLRQACLGLQEAQRLGVLHRDIKPDNLMLTDRGVLKIADFGIAKPSQDDFSMTLTSELIGTPLYMSPEQCQAVPDLDFRSDMYSLGATFYYLLTGEPPIRASSVYELIQTKTKLENLCLWKALAELDEDHPLSQVIARMTALSREDRYPSYAALLADLELVEQGRTMEIAAPAAAATRSSGGSGGLLAALLLLALGGGGYAFWQYGLPAAPPVAVADTATQLRQLRAELRSDGPSAELLNAVGALAAAAAGDPEVAGLERDLELGVVLRAALLALPPLPELEPPFATLPAHVEQVTAALAAPAEAGPELLHWLQRQQRELLPLAELGGKAVARMAALFSTWQEDRKKAGGDAVALASLAQRLQVLEDGHGNLLQLPEPIPGELRQVLPTYRLQEARSGLAINDPPPVAMVDVGPALAEIRSLFAEQGPLLALENRLRELRPNEPAQLAAKEELLNELQRAESVLGLARSLRAGYPLEPQLPFDEVLAYYTAIDRELQPLQHAETGLPPWAAAVRSELRDEAALLPKLVQRCRAAFADWRTASAQPNSDLQRSEQALALLRQGFARAQELFPAAAAEFDAIADEGRFTAALAELGRQGQVRQRLQTVGDLLQRLSRLPGLADWQQQRQEVMQALSDARVMAQEFGDVPELGVELRRAEAVARRWQEAEERVQAVTLPLSLGNLPGAAAALRNPVSGTEGRDEFLAFAAAVEQIEAALALIPQRLDLPAAEQVLQQAHKGLRPFLPLAPAVGDRLERWQRALQSLAAAAAGMAPIAAGRIKAGTEVPGFFLAKTEVSQRDYRRFLDELQAILQAAGATDAAAQQQALALRLGEFLPPADVLQRMLARRSRIAESDLPIDDVCWHEAAAYAAFYQLALPTAAEWALAAFGDGHRYEFPWGNGWKDTDDARNIRNSLVAVHAGGRSWRDGVHHLAGNVAEWLAAAPSAAEAQLAGGSYRDNDVARDVRRRAAGEEFARAALKKNLPGFGFRTVLRPAAALAAEFPDGVFPGQGR